MRVKRNQGLFLSRLDSIDAWMESNDVPYRVLGSLGVASYLDGALEGVDFDRKGGFSSDQRVPDIDLLVPRWDATRVHEYGQKLLGDPDFPLRLDLVAGVKHIDLREDGDESYLFHRELRVPVPTRLFKPVIRPFGSTSIVTVDPLTLQHTFGVWGGILRAKDLPRVRSVVEYNGQNDVSEFTEADFAAFHQFLRDRRRQYPWYTRARKLEMAVGAILPKPAENGLRIIYKRMDARGGKT
jgi:hypothetical protein